MEAWPGLEQALRASTATTTSVVKEAPRKKVRRTTPLVHNHDDLLTMVTQQAGSTENGERAPGRAGSASGKPKKPDKGYTKHAPKKASGVKKARIVGNAPHLVSRKSGRIVEPRSARVGEGLFGLGRVLCTSLLLRCGTTNSLSLSDDV